MGAGKTTAQDHLVRVYGAQPWTTSGRIKQISHALIDQTGSLDDLLSVVILDHELRAQAAWDLMSYAGSYEPEPGKPRKLYQDVGEILRDLSPVTRLCWEEDLQRCIISSPASFPVVDIRSKESYAFFAGEHHYRTLRIDAPLEVRKARMLARDKHAVLDEAVFNHQSETDVDDLQFDFVIDNSSDDPTTLYEALDQVVAQIAR
jgi:hypothetical protein